MKSKDKFQKKKVAVFDLDGTVFRSSLLIELLEELVAEGIFPAQARKIYEKQYLDWFARKGSYEDYIAKVIETYGKLIAGIKAEKVWQAAQKVIAFQKNRVYCFTRNLISSLKGGRYLLAISGSPREMVKNFGGEFGFNKVYGRIFAANKQGRFTGQILYEEIIKDKGEILLRAVEKENLTLRGSIGVGDTEDDIPFLKLVECPIAFNPNAGLYRYAFKKKWPIVVERKDVIYKINREKLPAEVKISLK